MEFTAVLCSLIFCFHFLLETVIGFCPGPLRITCDGLTNREVRRRQACSQGVSNPQGRLQGPQDISSVGVFWDLILGIGSRSTGKDRLHSCNVDLFSLVVSYIWFGYTFLSFYWFSLFFKKSETTKLRSRVSLCKPGP